jgi:hypothetical protein
VKKLLILLSFITLSAFAMQQDIQMYQDLLPVEIRKEMFNFLISKGDLSQNLQKFYESSPTMQKSVILSKELLSSLIKEQRPKFFELETIVRALSKYKAFGNRELKQWLSKEIARLKNETALRSIAHYADSNEIKNLIAKGVNVNAQDCNGNTALSILVSVQETPLNYKSEAALVLLKAGADPNLNTIDGLSLANYARNIMRHYDLAKLLIQYGARDQ